MGAATSMPTILIVSPAVVEPLAEDQLAGFVQHQQLVVVLPDGDVELLLGVHVVAFPQGVVLGPAPLEWGLGMHWSMCACVCELQSRGFMCKPMSCQRVWESAFGHRPCYGVAWYTGGNTCAPLFGFCTIVPGWATAMLSTSTMDTYV